MKKVLIILFVFFAFQTHAQNAWQLGTRQYDIPKFLKRVYFKDVSYWAYSEPKKQKALKKIKLSNKALKDPVKVIQSYLAATDTAWLAKLYAGKGNANLSEKKLAFRNSKEYKDGYLFEIWIEFWFTLEGKNYRGYVIRHQVEPEGYYVFPYIVEQVGEEWKITTDKQIAGLSYFMLLEPLHFERFLFGAFDLDDVHEDYKEYIFKQTFRVDKGFSFKSLIGRNAGAPGVADNQIPNSGQIIKQDFEVSYRGNTRVGISYVISEQRGTLFKYDNKKVSFFDNNRKGTVMNENPEEAVASFMFAKGFENKGKVSIGAPKVKEQLLGKEYHNDNEFGDIKLFRKTVFHSEGVLYAIVYFHNYEPKPRGSNISYTNIGRYRLLLRWQDGQWWVDFDPTWIIRRSLCHPFRAMLCHPFRTSLCQFIASP
ncbi:hypothetical protein RCC89_18530 [Cytophagaceae bacterium ABcell3]|nr:hypothetical protein RCC89_18530 [Cytophagaceae bacterium ABcell3]